MNLNLYLNGLVSIQEQNNFRTRIWPQFQKKRKGKSSRAESIDVVGYEVDQLFFINLSEKTSNKITIFVLRQ